MTSCFVGAGANLGEPLRNLRQAWSALRQQPGMQSWRASSIYRSAAVGPGAQEDYLNAVFACDCELDADALLDVLQSLERDAGRERLERWGPRTLDLDLLIYGSECRDSERLTLPHPRIYERNFVLLPLAELCGERWRFPDGSTVAERLAACPPNPIERKAHGWDEPVTGRRGACA